MKIKQLFVKLIPKPIFQYYKIKKWKLEGKPIPPPHLIKQLAIKELKSEFGIKVFVETGTYLGEMVYAMKTQFHRLYSIELSDDLWKSAVAKFKNHSHINILHGDSGKVLFELVPKIKDKALFWLDGHYSGDGTAKGLKECPIFEELTAILNSEIDHVILIDDARLFNGTGDYPTIEDLSAFVSAKRGQSGISVKNDIIRIIS